MMVSSLIFVVLGLWIFFSEARRQPDVLSIFILYFALQVVLPGIVLPVLLVLSKGQAGIESPFLSRLYSEDLAASAVVVALMATIFVIFLYLGFNLRLAERKEGQYPGITLRLSKWWVGVFVALGIVAMLFLLHSMPGSTITQRYFALVLFRSKSESAATVAPSFMISSLFTLTQTFSIAVLFLVYLLADSPRKIPRIAWIAVGAIVIAMTSFSVSRRAIFIQLIILYSSMVLLRKRWYISRASLLLPLGLVWLAYGKDILGQLPSVTSTGRLQTSFNDEGFIPPLLNSFSSLGITLNSSWATLEYMSDEPVRFGLDHALSAIRRLPLQSLGVDEDALFGPRIVRISTERFVGSEALDIPPGMFGQMWLDGKAVAPIIWGLVFGMILRLVKRVTARVNPSWAAAGVVSIMLYLVALPLNSGSLDFLFSVDVIFLLVIVGSVVRIVTTKKSYLPSTLNT